MKLRIIILFFCCAPLFSLGQDSLFLKGEEYLLQKQYDAAEVYFMKDLQQKKNFSSFYNLGVTYGEQEDWHRAKWAFESALKYHPMDNKAQFNAEFVSHQIDSKDQWEHPYSWFLRFVLGVGSLIWSILLFIGSTVIGLYLFWNTTKRKDSRKYKRIQQLLFPFLVLMLFSLISLFAIRQHFKVNQFAIMTGEDMEIFLSPEGVEIENLKDYSGYRFRIQKYSNDGEWIQLHFPDEQFYWVKAIDVLTY